MAARSTARRSTARGRSRPTRKGKVCFTRAGTTAWSTRSTCPDEGETLPRRSRIAGVQPRAGESECACWATRSRCAGSRRARRANPPSGGGRRSSAVQHAWALRLGQVVDRSEPLPVADLARLAHPRTRSRFCPGDRPRRPGAAGPPTPAAGVELPIARARRPTRPRPPRPISLSDRPDAAGGRLCGCGSTHGRIEIAAARPRGRALRRLRVRRALSRRALPHRRPHPHPGRRRCAPAAARDASLSHRRSPSAGRTSARPDLHPAFAARLRVNTVAEAESLGGLIAAAPDQPQPGRAASGRDLRRRASRVLRAGPRRAAPAGLRRRPSAVPDESRRCCEIVTAAVLEEIAAHPERRNVSVSQTDNDLYCRCPACEAIHPPEGTPMGTHARVRQRRRRHASPSAIPARRSAPSPTGTPASRRRTFRPATTCRSSSPTSSAAACTR